MAVCGGCGAETTRIRITYHEDKQTGKVIGQTDECDMCKPNSFDPQWLNARLVQAHEAFPSLYKKTTDAAGRTIFVSTEERQADLAARLAARPKDEVEAERRAIEKRRRNRRTTPMTPSEVDQALKRLRPVMEAKAEDEKKEKQQARDAWLN